MAAPRAAAAAAVRGAGVTAAAAGRRDGGVRAKQAGRASCRGA